MPCITASSVARRRPPGREAVGPFLPCYARRMPSPSAAPRPMTTTSIVVMLTLLLGIQPVTTDLYLPALPTLQRELGATIGAAQYTLAALVIAFGFGQLVCG